ncbi:tetratricopeptide repeat protein [Pontibacter cellulosilyticus]|uniref:Tetratricopeptide repeat protein n=1 Tax=Pontibacter cellulosilyticus TaxID=1720253 RepID=A0A923N7Q8_9BACT|nr:hypothetical protein [Pontibacter cellulosilyticus]MBC5992956.1 hypothetical protein [Pontibacter cellulosilyticus]
MRQALLLLSLLLAVNTVQAQTKIVFEETTSDTYLMKYGNSSQASLNSIIILLENAQVTAQGGGRPNRKPEFTVRLEQHARITDTGDQLLLQVNLKNVTVTGDINNKGFDLADVLKPEELKYKVWLLNSKNEKVKEFTNQRLGLHGDNQNMLQATIPDTAANQNFKLKIEEKQVNYTYESENRVKERLNLVKEYFAAEAKIQRALQEVAHIRPDDVDRIELQDRNLKEMEVLHANLKGQLAEKLNLEKNDPQRLNYKLTQLQETLQDRRRAINHTLATLDQQFFNRGLSLMQRGNRSGAQVYFMKAVEANPRFAPAHVELARLDFMGGYIREASNRTRDVFTSMRVDRETEAIALELMYDIYGAYISSGNTLTTRGDYHNALASFAEARELCSTVRGLRCNTTALAEGEGRAALGVYRALVDNGKRLLDRNDLREAERVAGEALAFQRDYDFALSREQEATELMGQVKFQYYLQHIDLGKRYLSQQNYDAALREFEGALELESRYTFKPVQELGALAQKAAKPILIAKLTEGYEQAMQNRLSNARATASAATAMQERYGLKNDAEVLNKYNLLRERIFTQECVNTQVAYDKHYQNARDLISQRKYVAADQAFMAAIKAADEKADCNVATFTAKDGRNEILVAATYQRMLEDANRHVSTKRYADAVQLYEQARAYYVDKGVGKFGLNHVSLFNFAKENNRQDFTAHVVSYFASIQEEEVAVQLLTSLLDRGYAKRKTKKVQEQLGKQLALKDAGTGPWHDAKTVAAQYTQSHKGLKKLRKAYVKERKRLAKLG